MARENVIVGFFICFNYIQIDAARILAMFPMPAVSHQVVFRPLTQELAKRGHQVIVITPYPAYPIGQAPTNLTEIDVYDTSYDIANELRRNHKGKKADMLLNQKRAFELQNILIERQLQTSDVQELLKMPKDYFDLLLLEACLFLYNSGLSNKFDAPIIHISSYGAIPDYYSLFGAPIHPLLYPTPMRQRIYNLTRCEKIIELLKYAVCECYILLFSEKNHLRSMRNIFGNVENEGSRLKLLFSNEHRIWADNRPISSNIQYLGGIHHPQENELPKDLKSYLDTSRNGVIYVSFGTSALTSALAPEKIDIIITVLSQLEYDVLMKWDADELPHQPPNVKIQKWFPQSDLLRHPNIKLFITQAGLQSTDEAINAAVPLLGVPILGDQWYNAEKYVQHKVGMKIDFDSLNELEFKKNIETIIKDTSYKRNMLKLRKLMREYPIKPLDLAVWWTEHIIKYGGDHLVPPSANISWIEYYEVELIVICLSVLSVFMFFVVYIIKGLAITIGKNIACRSKKVKTK